VSKPWIKYDLVRGTGALITDSGIPMCQEEEVGRSVAFIHRKSHKDFRGIETRAFAVWRWQTAWALSLSIPQSVQQNSVSLAATFHYLVSDVVPKVYAK